MVAPASWSWKDSSVATKIPLEPNLSIPQHWMKTHQRVRDNHHGTIVRTIHEHNLHICSVNKTGFLSMTAPLARWAHQVYNLTPFVQRIPESQDCFSTVESQIALTCLSMVIKAARFANSLALSIFRITFRYNYNLRLLHSSVYNAINGRLCHACFNSSLNSSPLSYRPTSTMTD